MAAACPHLLLPLAFVFVNYLADHFRTPLQPTSLAYDLSLAPYIWFFLSLSNLTVTP